MVQKKKKIVKGDDLLDAVDSAVSVIEQIYTNAIKAIVVATKDNTKLTKETKRISKKRSVLMKKKKSATAKVKKSPISANKKALKSVEKDITAIIKESDKISVQKSDISEELVTLKTVSKRTIAYMQGVKAADKVLNKPKAKPKKKNSPKKAVLNLVTPVQSDTSLETVTAP